MGVVFMNSVRYLVARYIPDLLRYEPRNIGVVVWTDHGIAGRFLGEREGRIDLRRIPDYVNNRQMYRQWIGFWRLALQRPALSPLTGGISVPLGAPEFLDALCTFSRSQYQLVEGGMIFDSTLNEPLDEIIDDLYYQLVRSDDEPRDATLEEICDRLIDTTGMRRHPLYLPQYSLQYVLDNGESDPLRFSYALVNGTPKLLYQRVPLRGSGSSLLRIVHDVAWQFERVSDMPQAKNASMAALVYLHRDEEDDSIRSALGILRSRSRVIDVSRQEEAVEQVQADMAAAMM
jgi:hypothetical protein